MNKTSAIGEWVLPLLPEPGRFATVLAARGRGRGTLLHEALLRPFYVTAAAR